MLESKLSLPTIITPLQPLTDIKGRVKAGEFCKYGMFKNLLSSLITGVQVLKHSITGFVSSDKKSFEVYVLPIEWNNFKLMHFDFS